MGITLGEGACMEMRSDMALPSNVFTSKFKARKTQSKEQETPKF